MPIHSLSIPYYSKTPATLNVLRLIEWLGFHLVKFRQPNKIQARRYTVAKRPDLEQCVIKVTLDLRGVGITLEFGCIISHNINISHIKQIPNLFQISLEYSLLSIRDNRHINSSFTPSALS